MAAKGRILALMLVCCALLPLLATSDSRSEFTELRNFNDGDDSPALLDYDLTGDENFDDILEKKRSKDEKKKKEDKKKKKKDKKKDKKKRKEEPVESEPEPEPEPEPEEGAGKPNEPEQGVDKPDEPEQGVDKPDEPAVVPGGLKLGFYEQTCPQAERVIQETMDKIFERNVKMAPSLVRLFFHDCFVTGCDASILLDQTPSGENVEKEAPQNGEFVRGFEEIEELKAALEAECPGIVSCADTLAFANREALAQTGVPRYPLAAGRRDRPISLATNVEGNIPFPDISAQDSIQLFARKGMTLEDLVVLIGSHSIGESHCTVFGNRFQDPEKRKDINPRYLDQMHVHLICVDPNQTLPFDRMSQNIMDAGFYKQLLAKETLIESDHNLVNEVNANGIMKRYADDQEGWMAKFTQSIIKLGEIEVLTGDQGEIRKQCRAFN